MAMTRYEFEQLLNNYGLTRLWRSDATGLAAIGAGEEYDMNKREVWIFVIDLAAMLVDSAADGAEFWDDMSDEDANKVYKALKKLSAQLLAREKHLKLKLCQSTKK
jgi:hypothetical protein